MSYCPDALYLNAARDLPEHLKGLAKLGPSLRVNVTESVEIPPLAGTWSGGTRELFDALELATGRRESITDTASAPWNMKRAGRTVALRDGFAVVEYGTFCGKPSGVDLHIHPANAPKLLPAAPTVARDEAIVLTVTASLISRASPDAYLRAGLKLDDVPAIIKRLQARGLMSPQRGITPDGRNAATAAAKSGLVPPRIY